MYVHAGHKFVPILNMNDLVHVHVHVHAYHPHLAPLLIILCFDIF